MATDYTSLSCTEFAAQLAAKQSVPGGGGASALVGALAASLGAMTANFTTGKKAYAQYEEDLQRIIAELDELRAKMLGHVNGDAESFGNYMEAFRMPKDDPNRDAALEQATKDSAASPFAMMQDITRIIEVLEELATKGSKMLLSDTACGASLARAALETASINVYVNARSSSDAEWAQDIETQCDLMLAEYGPRADRVFRTITAKTGR